MDNGKDFECICGEFTVKGSLDPLVDLEGCPIHGCGRGISLPRIADELHELSPTYFSTTGKDLFFLKK